MGFRCGLSNEGGAVSRRGQNSLAGDQQVPPLIRGERVSLPPEFSPCVDTQHESAKVLQDLSSERSLMKKEIEELRTFGLPHLSEGPAERAGTDRR